MIPIFVLTCDRLTVTREAIKSYHDCIKTPFELVMVDFGSSYTPTVEYLKRLEQRGIKVYWEKPISQANQLNKASACIDDYFKTRQKMNYVVTDPDVALDSVKGDILDVYSHFLDEFQAIDVVGPMLRTDDIPDFYVYKEHILAGTMGLHKKFHLQTRHSITYNGIEIFYIFAPIDTTFGMYRAGTLWARSRMGIRVLSPYSARHLDWYIDFKNPTPDQAYYMEHASKNIAHWSQSGE